MEHTKSLYKDENRSSISSKSEEPEPLILADIAWEGQTRKVLKSFPESPRMNLGYHLWLVQQGIRPPGSSPVPGLEDVFEIRDEDARAWYRVLYLKRVNDRVHVLHCFEKRSNQIEKRDIETAKKRLTEVRLRLKQENRDGKKKAARGASNEGERPR